MSKPPLTEKVFTQMVIDLVHYLGWMAYHTHDSRHSEPGFPDLCMVKDGRIVFAELKTETGKSTPHQEHWLKELSKCNAEVYLWRPSDWEDIAATLATNKNRGE